MDSQFKFKSLVNRHHRLVYAIALRILNNQAEAEDATQEVYERVWKHIQIVEENEAKAWLSKVTKNICIDKLRRKRPCETLDSAGELVCAHAHTSAALEHEQLSDWLRTAIGKLKEPFKSLIMMLEIQQKTVREAAQATQLSENQVKVYSHRARNQLKALLQGIDI